MTSSNIFFCLLLSSFLLLPAAAWAQGAPRLALPPEDSLPSPVIITAPTPQSTGLAVEPPVQAAPLPAIKPDTVGLIRNDDGGLGASLWKGTSRLTVESLLPNLVLPTPYASLNQLAVRLLLTTATPPDGDGSRSLTAMRAEKLIALGKSAEAWKLVALATDTATTNIELTAAQAALLSDAADSVCAAAPDFVKKQGGAETEKLLLTCQLRARDIKAAQLTLDLLRPHVAADDVFVALVDKNILTTGKQVPRQLTPLQPLTMALLGMAEIPLRGELYARPDAAVIPALLQAKAQDEKARLALAERAAARGMLSADQLTAVYKNQLFPPESLANGAIGDARDGTLRAMIFQASQQDNNPRDRIGRATRFAKSLDGALMNGGVMTALAGLIGDIPASADFNTQAASVARLYLLTGQKTAAQAWLDQAAAAARGMPAVAEERATLWPLAALMDLQDKDGKDQLAWVDAALRDPTEPDPRLARTKASSILALLHAAGAAISETAWAKVGTDPVFAKVLSAPPMYSERLLDAKDRRGETILLILAMMNAGKEEPPLAAVIDAVRALRQNGLDEDATALARDVLVRLMFPVVKN